MTTTPRVDALMQKWDDDGATRGSAFCELRDLARELEREVAELHTEVRAWACNTCNTAYPGQPEFGRVCLTCPKCGGTTAPLGTIERLRLEKRVADFEAADASRRALVRELDVLLNGEDGAARQASLCDIVAQVRNENLVPATKATHWFSVLTECARLLNVPNDEPIPSGVRRRVTEMTYEHHVSKDVQIFAIDVEKRLCAALGRPWTPAGISIDSLIGELARKA
jgi:hypothetical protein